MGGKGEISGVLWKFPRSFPRGLIYLEEWRVQIPFRPGIGKERIHRDRRREDARIGME